MKRIYDLRPQDPRRFKAIVLPAVMTVMAVQIGCDPNDPALNGETGTTTRAIVGGADTTIEQHPWQVTLQVPEVAHWCGGSILSLDWILTAAHCVDGFPASDVTVRAGLTRLSQSDRQISRVSEIIVFPGYVHPTLGKDVALLRLSTPLDLSGPKASAIGLVTQRDEALGLTDPGVDTLVTGWGALSEGGSGPDTLQVVEVPVISNAVAEQAYQAIYPTLTITDDQLAAGLFNIGGKDSCQGDSGGPLTVVNGSGTRLLAGVVSWGFGCARPQLPGMYARVSRFVAWIEGYTSPESPRGRVLTQTDAGGDNEAGDLFGDSLASGDFNGDGFEDLVVGAPGGAPSSDPQSGAIFIFRGSSDGLRSGRILTQANSGGGANEAGDLFGQSAATGDFNGDGFDDLIVGGPGESPGPDPQSGAVFVFDGSPAGLSSSRVLTQTDAQGVNEAGDRFGWSFAVGDYDGDGFEDVVVAGPGESPDSGPNSGAVFILMGSPSGLANGRFLTQTDAGALNEAGDLFGYALAAGDFDNDGFDDLVVGGPGESPDADPKSGAVYVFPGSSSGLNAGWFFTQTYVGGVNEAGDQFGHSLATGDFDNDGFDDLVVGGPGESLDFAPKSGAIFIVPGSSAGLSPGRFLTQSDAYVTNENGDLFGDSLVVGDLNGDGFEDLVVGAPGKSLGSHPQSGMVFVFTGAVGGLSEGRLLTQVRAGGSNEAGDLFGSSMTAGDFNSDGVDDLVVGAPGESPAADPQSGAVFFFEVSFWATPF